MNIDFPSSRQKFRESFGYDFPYDSDEEPEAIDRKYKNDDMRFSSIKSSGTGSDSGIYVLQEELRAPRSAEDLLAAIDESDGRGRRMSDPSHDSEESYYGTSLGQSSHFDAKSTADSTFFLGALDQSSANASHYRESIKVPLRDSKSGDGYEYAPRHSNHTTNTSAASTFFFAAIDDEFASRMSRERIVIPTKSSPQGLDIGREMMQDDKSVRSALTCDKSYVLDGLFDQRGDNEDEESKHKGKSQDRRGSITRTNQSDEESDRHETRSRSGLSLAGSTASSHHGSFMGWGDYDTNSDDEEEKRQDIHQHGRDSCGNVVCDFPEDRAAFRSRSNSAASLANSTTTAKSSDTTGTASRGSCRSSMSKNRRPSRGVRPTLETIISNKSFNKSLRGSLRASLSEFSLYHFFE